MLGNSLVLHDSVFSFPSEMKASCGSLQLQERGPQTERPGGGRWWLVSPPLAEGEKMRLIKKVVWWEGCKPDSCAQRLGSSLVLSFTH